jgi:hypothetical protein
MTPDILFLIDSNERPKALIPSGIRLVFQVCDNAGIDPVEVSV